MKTGEVKALLRQRFTAPTHAIFFEVSDATGFQGTGWADAISMSLWPSHGLHLEGYEIKVSRSDWKRELINPVKAEKFAARCDKWWLVTTENVVDDESEIPINWGWILANEGGLSIKRKATEHEPVPMDKNFLAALLRGAGKVSDSEVEAIVEKRVAELRKNIDREIEYAVERKTGRAGEDTKLVEKLRAALAADPDAKYIGDEQVVAAIVAVCKSGVSCSWQGLEKAAQNLEEAADKIRRCHDNLALPKAPTKKRRAA
jgi:hypothetical protein